MHVAKIYTSLPQYDFTLVKLNKTDFCKYNNIGPKDFSNNIWSAFPAWILLIMCLICPSTSYFDVRISLILVSNQSCSMVIHKDYEYSVRWEG